MEHRQRIRNELGEMLDEREERLLSTRNSEDPLGVLEVLLLPEEGEERFQRDFFLVLGTAGPNAKSKEDWKSSPLLPCDDTRLSGIGCERGTLFLLGAVPVQQSNAFSIISVNPSSSLRKEVLLCGRPLGAKSVDCGKLVRVFTIPPLLLLIEADVALSPVLRRT